jgi:hypothetical protein
VLGIFNEIGVKETLLDANIKNIEQLEHWKLLEQSTGGKEISGTSHSNQFQMPATPQLYCV